jgi:hypothetical protein
VASDAFVAIDTALIVGTALEGQRRTWAWDIP